MTLESFEKKQKCLKTCKTKSYFHKYFNFWTLSHWWKLKLCSILTMGGNLKKNNGKKN